MAPEVLRCPPKNLPQENKNNVNLHYNNSVDAWAVGVFAYELIVGFPPFAGKSHTRYTHMHTRARVRARNTKRDTVTGGQRRKHGPGRYFCVCVCVCVCVGESQLASVDKIIHATPEFPEKISELAKAFITAVSDTHTHTHTYTHRRARAHSRQACTSQRPQ